MCQGAPRFAYRQMMDTRKDCHPTSADLGYNFHCHWGTDVINGPMNKKKVQLVKPWNCEEKRKTSQTAQGKTKRKKRKLSRKLNECQTKNKSINRCIPLSNYTAPYVLSKVIFHVLWKEPVYNCWAINDMHAYQLIYQHNHDLLMKKYTCIRGLQ